MNKKYIAVIFLAISPISTHSVLNLCACTQHTNTGRTWTSGKQFKGYSGSDDYSKCVILICCPRCSTICVVTLMALKWSLQAVPKILCLAQTPERDKGVCLSKDKHSWGTEPTATALSFIVLLLLCTRPNIVVESSPWLFWHWSTFPLHAARGECPCQQAGRWDETRAHLQIKTWPTLVSIKQSLRHNTVISHTWKDDDDVRAHSPSSACVTTFAYPSVLCCLAGWHLLDNK